MQQILPKCAHMFVCIHIHTLKWPGVLWLAFVHSLNEFVTVTWSNIIWLFVLKSTWLHHSIFFTHYLFQSVLYCTNSRCQGVVNDLSHSRLRPGGGWAMALCWHSKCHQTDGSQARESQCYYILCQSVMVMSSAGCWVRHSHFSALHSLCAVTVWEFEMSAESKEFYSTASNPYP